ncbi:RNF114 [Symbiodinium necroappetens]|uniref:RNF114 protein n=1 Tax=Symbiodinium necroappetens TaxID=1628268 RepID=A0A812X150_9DINO|nr:RNF114 [Symbiodinium necroappetens]
MPRHVVRSAARLRGEEVNLSPQALLEHCKAKHQGPRGPTSAVCPICAAMPWGDPSYVSRNFISHLELRHRCDYAVLTDFDVDEEASHLHPFTCCETTEQKRETGTAVRCGNGSCPFGQAFWHMCRISCTDSRGRMLNSCAND